jgi:CHAD domain-containing protein
LTSLSFEFPTEFDLQALLDQISAQYLLIADHDESKQISYFDTFDWRLFNNDLSLYQSEDFIILEQINNGSEIERIKCSNPPGFSFELPESRLRQRISSIIDPRALIKLTKLTFEWKGYRVLNEDQKTVTRFQIEEIKSPEADEAAATQLRLVPVRGYPRYYRELANLLTSTGFVASSNEDLFIRRLEFAGKSPGDYSAKLNFRLDPTMRADVATKIIMRFLLGVIRVNEQGIKDDIDTEFLHDFRVAIRRTRSALSQIREVFPAEFTERFKIDFRYLGSLTNELRDLDVYLLNEGTYKSMLPEFLREDIEPLFNHLKNKRSSALQSVIEGLESEKYALILKDWGNFLDQPPVETTSAPNASRPIIDLASERIYKRFMVIVKDGTKALGSDEEDLLHILRIDCKKLRYLLEFFTSLYPPQQTSELIRQLKTLQDNLGEFHDLCVQQEYLIHISEELAGSQPNIQGTLVSIGSLVGTLQNEKARVKSEFAETFQQFTSKKNRALFKDLFKKALLKEDKIQ